MITIIIINNNISIIINIININNNIVLNSFNNVSNFCNIFYANSYNIIFLITIPLCRSLIYERKIFK